MEASKKAAAAAAGCLNNDSRTCCCRFCANSCSYARRSRPHRQMDSRSIGRLVRQLLAVSQADHRRPRLGRRLEPRSHGALSSELSRRMASGAGSRRPPGAGAGSMTRSPSAGVARAPGGHKRSPRSPRRGSRHDPDHQRGGPIVSTRSVSRSYGSVLKCYDQRPKAFARGRNLPIAKRGLQWPMLAFLVTIAIFF
jgi:hypothetical protein